VSTLNLDDFSNLREEELGFSIYILVLSLSILVMVAFNSFAGGITTNIILLSITHYLRGANKKKEGKQSPLIID
jgi:hypothetical protein